MDTEPGNSLTHGPVVGGCSLFQQDPNWPFSFTGNRLPPWVNPNPIRQPQPSFEDEAVTYFLNEYCIEPGPGGFGGHLDFLHDIYQSSYHNSCLRPATLAIACMSLSRYYKSSKLYFRARAYYGAALRAVNRNLSASSRTVKDDTLVSIMLLGMIEDIDSEDSSAKTNHMLAISKIYEIIGHRLLNHIHLKALDGWIFSELQITSFSANKSLDCLTIPDANLDTSNFYIRLTLISTRIGHFYRLAKQLTSSEASGTPETPEEIECQTLQREKLLSAIQQAMTIQSELADIAGSLPPDWKTWRTEGKRQANTESPAYPSRWITCLGCGFNMTLAIFYNWFLSCCRTLVRLDYRNDQPTPETHLAETSMPLANAQLKRLTTSLCTVMPYLMGEVDEHGTPLTKPKQKAIIMYRLIWPLAIVIASPQSTRQQVQDSQVRLDWIRDRYGIKLASAVSEMAKDIMN
ncbi:hypothetical protein NM208_g705 [Fusarium decemcellulare]|uniref:Uncharacterized protein n=1 Tax=Fusarium decemcellulare TaxID=57161 RepID=A0ACC1SYG7_9HYPO|nr:hypothetical protein NM208_g705 [Fusarium decemcellulare]